MKRYIAVFFVLVLLFAFCVPFAFAASNTETQTETYTGTETDTGTEYDDPLIPDTDLEGAVDKEDIFSGAVSATIFEVFEGFKDIWGTIPAAVRYVTVLGFVVACVIAVFKMLF